MNMENMMVFFVLVFGLVIGSFLNALIWRLHSQEKMWDRSRCPKCHDIIRWYDNLPVLSFVILGGKCRHCGKKISWQYPLVELLTAILFLYAWNRSFTGSWELVPGRELVSVVRDWFLISVMIVIFIYDLRWYLILDKITIPSFFIIGAFNLYLGLDWLNLLISVIIGGSFFLAQYVISKGKWIGGGDIRLGALMGAALGWPGILIALFLAYILGSIIGMALVFTGGKKWGSKVPFGTFLSVSALIALFWGRELMAWYFELISF